MKSSVNRSAALFTLVLASLSVLPTSPLVAQQPDCFDGDEKPQFQIMQQAPPPATDAAPNYRYRPASMIGTARINALQTTRATMPMFYWQWANHGPRRVPKSTLAIGVHPGVGTELFFSSNERADACTMAQTAALFGDGAEVDRQLGAVAMERRSEVTPGTLTDVCLVQKILLPA